jgi:D-alanyl-D-alanine carboxypeptidase (penicillin-binding protein 5/6)
VRPGRVPAFLFALSSLLSPATGRAAPEAPAPPPLAAKAWLLIDHDSGEVLAAHDADAPLPVASLTKLMTGYVFFERIRAGALKPGDRVTVSERAATGNGARLFLRAGEVATVEDLLRGMLVRSANDATRALVDHAGGERQIVETMNRKAHALGLSRSIYVNSTGLDAEGQVSSAADIARLAGRLLRDFPESYRLFALKEFRHNGIPQYNRNALLWRDESVDGVKTGHTRAAGYCLVASARRGAMRLTAVVLGARDEAGRVEGAQRLFDYGFRQFETRLLYAADTPAARVRVWMGDRDVLPLGLAGNLYLTLPRGAHERLRARLSVSDTQFAPIRRGQSVGTLRLELGEQLHSTHPLIALTDVGAGNLWQRALDQIQFWLQ